MDRDVSAAVCCEICDPLPQNETYIANSQIEILCDFVEDNMGLRMIKEYVSLISRCLITIGGMY